MPLPYTLWKEPLSGPTLNRGHFPSFADFCKTQWISVWCPEASYLPGKHHPGWKARDPVHPAGQLQPPLPGPGFASYDFVVTMPFVSPRMWGSALMLPWSQATFRPFYHTDTLLEDETQRKSFTLCSESTPIKVTPNFLFVQRVCSICLIGKEIMHSHLLFQPIHYHHQKRECPEKSKYQVKAFKSVSLKASNTIGVWGHRGNVFDLRYLYFSW